MATVLRSPVITRIPRPSSDVAVNAQSWVSSGGLFTLLAVDPTIFRQPLVIRIERPSTFVAVNAQMFVWSNALLTLYAAQAPFSMLDWPNPLRQVSSVLLSAMIGNLLETTLRPPTPTTVTAQPIWDVHHRAMVLGL